MYVFFWWGLSKVSPASTLVGRRATASRDLRGRPAGGAQSMRPLREWIDQASIQTELELLGHHTTKSSGPMAVAYPPYKHATQTPAESDMHTPQSGIYLLIKTVLLIQIAALEKQN